MKEILNEDLLISDIPADNDISGANRFAHSITSNLESFKKVAEISKKVKIKIKEGDTDNLDLTEIRISLFFYFRSIRHGGNRPNAALVNKHLELIRDRVSKNEDNLL